MALLPWLVLALVAGAFAYSVLVLVAARSYLRVRPPALARPIPISVLKPLSGLDEGLEENLESFYRQSYPEFELIFAVRHADDPAARIVEKLSRQYAGVRTRFIVTGEPPYPNAKVYALERMLAEARHDLLVTADSDIRARPAMLLEAAAEFQDERLGLATYPYRAVPGSDPWSRLEALGMNTELLAGILVARVVEGMKFGVGPSMVVRRRALQDIGGFARLKDYLAEDFMMGKLIAEAGWNTILSSHFVEHRIGTQRLLPNFEHRLRWVRSTRRSRPAGYFGQLFTYPLPLALLLWLIKPAWWPFVAATIAVRGAAFWATAWAVLRDPATLRLWWLVPLEDLLSFGFWLAGFFGNTVSWRGRRYLLRRDGTFELVTPTGEKVGRERTLRR